MSDASPFHPNSLVSRLKMIAENAPQLYKLRPGVKERIIIPNSPACRVIMPVHFGKGMSVSRVCRCSHSCQDCADNLPLSFHLYVGCYRGRIVQRSLIALGTALPKQWERELPSFKHPFDVWREDTHSPIKLLEQEWINYDMSAFPAWDAYQDVANIFKGRGSAAIAISNQALDDETGEKGEDPDEIPC